MFSPTISHGFVVFSEDFPTHRAHEAAGGLLVILSHLAHPRARDEIEALGVSGLRVEELHFSLISVVSGNLERKYLNTVQLRLHVDEDLLAMPDIVEVTTGLGVLHTGGVASGNEMSDSAVNTGRGVPQDFGGATVVHGGGPDTKDGVLGVESAIVEEGLVLLHAVVKGDIVVLAPATERVEEEDGVLEALLEELNAGVLEEKDVTIMERVAHLESVNGISVLLLDGSLDLLGGHSIFVNSVVPLNGGGEVHAST